MTRRAGCQKAITELSLQNSQSLSHLRYPTDIRQLTSPQGEADGVSDGGMTLQALGGVNSPCDWYRIRGQPLSTGGQEHTHTHTHTHKTTYMANLFGRCILLFAFAYAGGDPPPNQIVLLDNIEHTRNGVANTFSIRETHTAHGRKMHPSFEDFITKIFDFVRRHIFLLALGGPCFAHGCCLSLSLTRCPPVAILLEKCTGTFFSLSTKTLAITTVFQYEKTISLLLPLFSWTA